MKRRLNVLCLIVLLVLSYSVLEAGYYFFVGAKAGIEAATEKGVSPMKQKELMNMKYISLVSHSFTMAGGNILPDSVYNEKTGKYLPAVYASMAVSIDTHPAMWEVITEKALGFLQIGLSIWAAVLFIRLIIAINKSNIFNWKNVRRLRCLGLALIVSFCCTFFAAYLSVLSIEEVFSLHGYSLCLSEVVSITTLVLGLCSLIVGEVFAIGLKMKEEQDLTI